LVFLYLNLGGAEWAAIATAGAGVLIALINAIAKAGVKKNPYRDANINPTFTEGMARGTVETNFPVDPNEPVIDNRGRWVDPQTGNPVDPRTGQQLILGMNPYLALGLGAVIVVAGGIVTYKLVAK
jgi:hypothetical protein